MKQAELIQSLREFADWLETKDFGERTISEPSFLIQCESADEFRSVAKIIGGFEKVPGSSFFSIVKKFGGITLDAYVLRDFVCERVQVGTKIVTARDEEVIPAQPERIEPLYEFHCPDSIFQEDTKTLIQMVPEKS